jgi:DNA helicase-2/ATP-dependent DNA helicase PcrA
MEVVDVAGAGDGAKGENDDAIVSQPQDDWANGLLDEQKIAASHEGSNARLLSGPGTGKTLTLRARVEYLVLEKKVDPSAVTALTFTRAAAGELRSRVDKALEGKVVGRPRIQTLHSFALRTLMRNDKLLGSLPTPLRVADEWEERNIIREDLKAISGTSAKEVRENFQKLSADWDTLRSDANEPSDMKADAKFVGAWLSHRSLYKYTLRSELVYQLKRALEQRDDLDFDGDIKHLLVDEYQDLNACDLGAIAHVASKSAVIFAAGDDDQSIYGFRHANPQGIRRFDKEHAPSTDLPLGTCMRCDKTIMELARFVADLDPARLQKPWAPRGNAGDGAVQLLRFSDGAEEAAAVASLCRHLITDEKYAPDDILILIRSDFNGAFSKPLSEQMKAAGVPLHLEIDSDSPLDSDAGRVVLSVIRLLVDDADCLAWRTLFKVRKNNRIGDKTIQQIVDMAAEKGLPFYEAVAECAKKNKTVAAEFTFLRGLIAKGKAIIGASDSLLTVEQMQDSLAKLKGLLEAEGVTAIDDAFSHVLQTARDAEAASFDELVSMIAIAGVTPEQDRAVGAVNMLTMHKAKGLSARAVIVMACEDEYNPGRQQSVEGESDERRLLYVSLTRARQKLFVSYAQKRTGQQQHTGRDSGIQRRKLSRFLANAPIRPVDGNAFIIGLAAEQPAQ